MMRKSIFVIASLLLLLSASAAFGETPNVNYKSVRALGMGGPGITTMNDFSALMYNPAQLSKCKFHIDIPGVQIRAGKDVVDMFEFYNDNEQLFDNFADTSLEAQNELLDGLAPFDDKWIGTGAYPTVGFTAKNFAIGGYAAADAEFKTDKGIFEPRVYMHGIGDYVFSAGIAFQMPEVLKFGVLPGEFHGGVSFKYITRYEVHELQLKASDMDLETVYDTLIENTETGYGVDLGLLYEVIPERLNLGLKVTDFLGKIGDENTPMLFNVGASFHLGKSLMLAADFNDFFFHYGENIFNKLYFGGEYSLGRILFLRGGFGQGYPAGGVGLNLGILTIDGAIYGDEKTDAPGGEGSYNYAVRLKLGV